MRCDTYKSSYCLRFVGQTPEMYLNTVKGAYLKKKKKKINQNLFTALELVLL